MARKSKYTSTEAAKPVPHLLGEFFAHVVNNPLTMTQMVAIGRFTKAKIKDSIKRQGMVSDTEKRLYRRQLTLRVKKNIIDPIKIGQPPTLEFLVDQYGIPSVNTQAGPKQYGREASGVARFLEEWDKVPGQAFTLATLEGLNEPIEMFDDPERNNVAPALYRHFRGISQAYLDTYKSQRADALRSRQGRNGGHTPSKVTPTERLYIQIICGYVIHNYHGVFEQQKAELSPHIKMVLSQIYIHHKKFEDEHTPIAMREHFSEDHIYRLLMNIKWEKCSRSLTDYELIMDAAVTVYNHPREFTMSATSMEKVIARDREIVFARQTIARIMKSLNITLLQVGEGKQKPLWEFINMDPHQEDLEEEPEFTNVKSLVPVIHRLQERAKGII